jgi:hypothetical protein
MLKRPWILDKGLDRDTEENEGLISRAIKYFVKPKEPLGVQNVALEVSSQCNTYKIIRLKDEQYQALLPCNVPISEDFGLLETLERSKKLIFKSFSRMHLLLQLVFGESGSCYSAGKSSFSFPFMIFFKYGIQEFVYTINIHNFRSSIEFSLAKLVPEHNTSVDRHTFHDPFEEFPSSEIRYVMTYFVAYLSQKFDAISKWYNTPFFHVVKSNQIIYGYKDGVFFDKNFSDDEDFDDEDFSLEVEKTRAYVENAESGGDWDDFMHFYIDTVKLMVDAGEPAENLPLYSDITRKELEELRQEWEGKETS